MTRDDVQHVPRINSGLGSVVFALLAEAALAQLGNGPDMVSAQDLVAVDRFGREQSTKPSPRR